MVVNRFFAYDDPAMEDLSLNDFFLRHVKGTPAEGHIPDVGMKICNFADAVSRDLAEDATKVHIHARALKHLYDKRPAEEFDSIIANLANIIRSPDRIYKNRDGKRASLCFCKVILGKYYFCALEKCLLIRSEDPGLEEIHCVVTCYRIREEKFPNYTKNYGLVWSWKGDIPSS